MKNKKKGFTIVELVIVIAVIGILSAILIPTFANLTGKAKEAALQSDLKTVYTEYVAEKSETDATVYATDKVVITAEALSGSTVAANKGYVMGAEEKWIVNEEAVTVNTTELGTYKGYTIYLIVTA